jgi:hypothetical protein
MAVAFLQIRGARQPMLSQAVMQALGCAFANRPPFFIATALASIGTISALRLELDNVGHKKSPGC